MGHSFVKFRGLHDHFYDGDLEFIIGAVAHKWNAEVEKEPSFQRLDKLMQWWLDPSSHPGSGCFQLRLDQYLRNEDAQLLLALLDKIRADLGAAGPDLSAQYLNQMILPDAARYQWEVSTEHFIAVIERFRAIVNAQGLNVC